MVRVIFTTRGNAGDGAPGRPFLLLLLLSLLVWVPVSPVFAAAADDDVVTIGVLAHRDIEQTAQRWQPLADYLSAIDPAHTFRIAALDYTTMEGALRQQEVDFLLTNPGHYVELRSRYPLSAPLATLVTEERGLPLAALGGAIITASEGPVRSIEALRGARVAIVWESSLGGFQSQALELQQRGLQRDRNYRTVAASTHDAVVQMVLDRSVDVGFVRAGIIEQMAHEGQLELERIRVLNRQDQPSYPYALSTRLYPEWPLSAAAHVDEELQRRLLGVLFALPQGSDVARSMGLHGFAVPSDYTEVSHLLESLRLPPYDAAPRFTFIDVWQRYHWVMVALAVAALLVVLLLLVLLAYNQRLERARSLLEQLADERGELLAAVGEGVYGCDAEGRTTFINPAALEMLGFSRDEVMGVDSHQLFHHTRADGSPYPHSHCPIHQTLEDQQRRETEEWFVRKDGSGFAVQMIVTAVDLPEQPGGAVVAFQEITTRKAVERDLQASERQFRSLFENAAVSIMIHDRETGAILDANGKALEAYGAESLEQLQGADLWGTPPYSADEMLAWLQRAATEGPQRFEWLSQRLDGKAFWEDVLLNTITLAGSERVISTAVDISIRKAVEADLQESNRELEQFAYAASHDMRQPLRMISSYLELLEDELADKLDDETRTFLGYARDGAKRMDAMLVSLLDYSRVGRKGEPPGLLESREALQEALTYLELDANQAGADIRLEGEWPTLRASRDELVRLFQNLVGNAIKYREQGCAPEIVVDSHCSGGRWRVEVRDNGIGIDPAQTEKLFQLFSRLQSRSRFEGSGIGLATCRKIVERLGGQIGVKSAGEGQGTTFHFSVPLPERQE